ncbi:hypothetical protein [Micromonospora globispora]|nr:hypothetical protein [Micromonospora globispora]
MFADAAGWIADVVAARAPQATYCLDPYHLVSGLSNARIEANNCTYGC